MPKRETAHPPYGDAINANRIDHILYFAKRHHVPAATAIEIVRRCSGDTLAAEAAVKAIRSYYMQSIDPE